jgi:hypothetical protein
MGTRVRVKDDGLEVVGHGRISSTGASLGDVTEHILLGTLVGAEPAYLHSLRQAMVRWRREAQDGPNERAWSGRDGCRVWIGLVRWPEEKLQDYLDQDYTWIPHDFMEIPPTSPAIFLEGDRLRMRIQVWREEKPSRTAARRLLAPFLGRHGASCEIAVTDLNEYDEEKEGFALTVDLDRSYQQGATVADAWKFGDEAQALLRAAEGEEIPQSVALDLLSVGRWDLFYGQRESEWLEAKAEPYDHLEKKGRKWRFELAKDVAAMANVPGGGMIVIGMSTGDDGDGDYIDGHLEFDLKRVKGPVYRRHVAQLVYPNVAGFEVRRIKGVKKGHGLAVLVIPPQPELSRPFLVQGSYQEGNLNEELILLPVRRGDETDLLDAGVLHTRLSLGQQLIAGKRPMG